MTQNTDQQQQNTDDIIARLTALWAFSECALGGIMHAFKLPFTAVFVGGFAVLCIGLLVHYSGQKAHVVLRATLLVVLAKAAVSPHSPPTAYLAVAFQGISGSILLCYGRPLVFMSLLFGGLALLESATQKLLTLWLFFGKSLFEAVDIFIPDVLENFGIHSAVSWSKILVVTYLVGYTLWGIYLGAVIPSLPRRIAQKSLEYADIEEDLANTDIPDARKKQRKKWLMYVLILLFICLTFWISGGKVSGGQKAIYAVWRTSAALLAWFFVVQPAIRRALDYWMSRTDKRDQNEAQKIVATFPALQRLARPLYSHLRSKYSGWRWLPEYVLALFVLALKQHKKSNGSEEFPQVGT
jgi:hypothetical protein